MKRLILASASEGRKKVLTQAGFSFSVYPSNFIEDLDSEADPYKLVSRLSLGKARAVAEKLRNASSETERTTAIHSMRPRQR